MAAKCTCPPARGLTYTHHVECPALGPRNRGGPAELPKAAIQRLPLRMADAAVQADKLYEQLMALAMGLSEDHNAGKALLVEAAESVSMAVRELLTVRR